MAPPMTISSALKRRAELKARLLRVMEDQSENFRVLIPVKYNNVKEALEKTPESFNFISFNDYEDQIVVINQEMMDLRFRIDKTGHATIVDVKGKQITLAQLRMLVEIMRARIDRLNKFKGKRSRGFLDRVEKLKTDDVEKEMAQVTDKELGKLIDDAIDQKVMLESILEKTNVETLLLD